MRLALPTRRRLAMTLAGLLVAAALASSCSLDADVSTDTSGRVTRIDALQIRSHVLDLALAVAVAVEGREWMIELRWRPFPEDSSLVF